MLRYSVFSDVEITFPAGILQPPFYDYNWPAYLKYGAFGVVAAHELTHLFDSKGAQYDETGRIRNWWTNATVKAFQERAQCIAKQYDTYYVYDQEGKKVYVNGNVGRSLKLRLCSHDAADEWRGYWRFRNRAGLCSLERANLLLRGRTPVARIGLHA